MNLVEIDHEDYDICPICHNHRDIWDWGDEWGDGDNHYENPILRCEDCDIEWRVEKVYHIRSIRVYVETEYTDPNNIGSHKFNGVLKIIGR